MNTFISYVKKGLLLALVFGFYNLSNSQPVSDEIKQVIDKIIEFKKMEKGHKTMWLEGARKMHDEKFALLIKMHNEMADLHIQKMEDIKNKGVSADLLNEYLDKCIKLHEEHIKQWQSLHESMNDMYNKNREKEMSELNDFKKSFYPQPEEAKAEGSPEAAAETKPE